MSSFEGVLSGLAGEIRSATTSDQYDLGGYTESRVRDLILSAFSTPLPAPERMIKVTFIVGGGKLVRSRYDDELPKWVAAVLREIAFVEDRSAAETFDSQGTYKQQHDTGQNLKYLIVFPFVACAQQSSNGVSQQNPVDQSSPEYIVIASKMDIFPDIIRSKVGSYAQKKRLVKFLQDKSEEFQQIESKLIAGAVLSESEQSIYDTNSGCDAEKIVYLQSEMKAMIDQGQLTAREKSDLINSINSNIELTKSEMEAAQLENKPKKAEKLEAKLQALISRKEVVERIAPISPDLLYSSQIQSLFLKLFPLRALEEKGRSMSLTLADLKLLEPKSDIETEIKSLEEESRGWFQEEDDFIERCRFVETAAKSKYNTLKANDSKKNTKTGSQAGKSSTASNTSWSTITKKSSNSNSNVTTKKSKASNFSALGDSDSD
jgi:hypothetical protein